MICNLGVVGSNPTRGSQERKFENSKVTEKGSFQSGQMGQTVNLLLLASVVRIHHYPLQKLKSGNSSVDRALAFQAGGRGFEPRFPLSCCNSSVVEHFLGKEEVLSSTLSYSSVSCSG